MLRPLSLAKTFDLYYSGDPAFEQPPPKPGKDATEQERAEYATAREAHRAKVVAAHETGDWSALLKPGETPTKFVMQQAHRPTWRAVMDRAELSEDSPRRLGPTQVIAIAFRLAIHSIPDLSGEMKHAPDKDLDGWKMAPASVIDTLDQIDPGIVGELGIEIIRRLSEGISPKS